MNSEVPSPDECHGGTCPTVIMVCLALFTGILAGRSIGPRRNGRSRLREEEAQVNTDMPGGQLFDSGPRRRRRELLAGAVGALGLIAAETVAGATPAQAANGDPVLQGSNNGPATSRTMVFTANNTEFASLADPNTSSKGSLGLYGHGQDIGVLGDSTGTGTGVQGNGGSNHGVGVRGNGGGTSVGVFGVGGPDNGSGVLGQANGTGIGVIGQGGSSGTGVQGTGSGAGHGVTGDAFGTGVGLVGTGNAFGVVGEATGEGVRGIGLDGVVGQTSTGNGVHGLVSSSAGVAVFAENTFGIALKATGRTVFNRSGVLTVPAGSSTVTHSGIALAAQSLILATLQQNRAGVFVQAAVPDVAGSSFTIHLSKAVSKNTTVAWLVVN